ncbi:AbgT family transporter [Prauserella sp. ASG 168]|uniref:AbgT family transporter n=1 Tax=Prauserella cavernicola TaxID=2800127 RepID=A0A934QVD5_9PSEU|nr:AbgT family transporter [Prauserella cavernicola]
MERVGNRVPNPLVLFAGLFVIILGLSAVLSAVGVSTVVPGSPDAVEVRSALAPSALVELASTAVENFVTFPALGPVLVVLLGIGVAQGSGGLEALVRLLFSRVPAKLAPYAVALVAAQGHVMSDASMIVIPPLAALIFRAVGRNPLAGLMGSFSVVAAGYGGGVLVGTLDVSFSGITQSAAEMVDIAAPPSHVLMNWFFAAATGLILPLVGGFIIDRVLEPRLRMYLPSAPANDDAADNDSDDAAAATDTPDHRITPHERKAVLISVGTTAIAFAMLIASALIPGSPWQGEDGGLVRSPLMSSLPVVISTLFFVFGFTYVRAVRRRGERGEGQDSLTLMQKSVAGMASFIVLMFVVAQTLAVLDYSNLAVVLAVQLSSLIETLNIGGFGALVILILISCVLNVLITSGAGLWSLEATVVVPALMLSGLSPAVIQAAHRIGDSVSTPLSPMTIYLWLVLAMAKQWAPDMRLGTFVTRILPFAPAFLVAWTGILAVFYFADLPVGPGMSVHLAP